MVQIERALAKQGCQPIGMRDATKFVRAIAQGLCCLRFLPQLPREIYCHGIIIIQNDLSAPGIRSEMLPPVLSEMGTGRGRRRKDHVGPIPQHVAAQLHQLRAKGLRQIFRCQNLVDKLRVGLIR
jgi:hypothetical protein